MREEVSKGWRLRNRRNALINNKRLTVSDKNIGVTSATERERRRRRETKKTRKTEMETYLGAKKDETDSLGSRRNGSNNCDFFVPMPVARVSGFTVRRRTHSNGPEVCDEKTLLIFHFRVNDTVGHARITVIIINEKDYCS
jgi:hypothetical protein